jgi:DNA-directed RNA polymerase beta subunit
MDDKLAKEIIKQLTRIADAMDKTNSMEEVKEKRRVRLEKLEEKHLKVELREMIQTESARIQPNLEK